MRVDDGDESLLQRALKFAREKLALLTGEPRPGPEVARDHSAN